MAKVNTASHGRQLGCAPMSTDVAFEAPETLNTHSAQPFREPALSRRRREPLSPEQLGRKAAEFSAAMAYLRPLPRHLASRILGQCCHEGLPRRPLLDSKTLREHYICVRSIDDFSTDLGLSCMAGISALKRAGVNVYEDVALEWDSGISIRELSLRYGIGRDTISRWIKRTGRDVPPANSRQRYDADLVARVFEQTNSVNAAATAAGIAWDTARKAVSRRHQVDDGLSLGDS